MWSSGADKNGGAWTRKVKYYSKSDEPSSKLPLNINQEWTSRCTREQADPGEWLRENKDKGYVFLIDDPTLQYAMSNLIDCSEKILNIWVFKSPLTGWQITQLFLNHQFVVIETDNWWWSIEKNAEEIDIQRSKYAKGVRDYAINEKRRTPLRRVSSDIGQKTMKELIEFLYQYDELNARYFLGLRDCQHFAEKVFNEFSKRKLHDIKFGCDPSGYDITMQVDNEVWDPKFWKETESS